MGEKKGIIKVRARIALTDNAVLLVHEDASFTPTPEFREAVEIQSEVFREPIITFINDAIGLFNWSAVFAQFDESNKIYECTLKCNSLEDAKIMVSIIKERIKHVEIRQFIYGGQL